MKRCIICLLFFNFFHCVYAYDLKTSVVKNVDSLSLVSFSNLSSVDINNTTKYLYKKPHLLDPFKGTFTTIGDFSQLKFNSLSIAELAFSTIFLMHYDQIIIDKAQAFGKYIGLDGSDNKINILPIPNVPIYIPSDLPSALYYIGDGWTHITITLAMGLYGKFAKNMRAYNTSFQLAEGLMVAGLYSQTIKHITGHESPFTATVPGGRWRLFPNQIDYQKHVPHYDAYPSGHVAATMMTITILSENYPENRFIKPVGYSLMTVLMYQMLNNGVHWMSDYPFSIVTSYVLGKIISQNNRIEIKKIGEKNYVKGDVRVFPVLNEYSKGLKISYTF